MIAVNEKTVVPFAIAALLVVGGFYFLLRKAVGDAAGAVGNAATAVNDARLDAASAIGETVFNWFHKNPSMPDVFVAVAFSDGTKHMISTRDIDANGFFIGTKAVYPWHDGKRYRIGTRGGVRYAVAA